MTRQFCGANDMMVRTNRAAESFCFQFVESQSRKNLTKSIREKQIPKKPNDKSDQMLKEHNKASQSLRKTMQMQKY